MRSSLSLDLVLKNTPRNQCDCVGFYLVCEAEVSERVHNAEYVVRLTDNDRLLRHRYTIRARTVVFHSLKRIPLTRPFFCRCRKKTRMPIPQNIFDVLHMGYLPVRSFMRRRAASLLILLKTNITAFLYSV